MLDWLINAAAVVVTFGMVIFLHESGHFFVCRWLGVRVERFAFGFGPELVGVTQGETRFSICAIPLGGFVKPAGEALEDATGAPDEYFSRTPWERLLIVAAGPVMNYVLAFLMFFGVVFFRGLPEAATGPVIGETAKDFPASRAGLASGDRVLKVGGVPVDKWEEMAQLIHRNGGRALKLEFARDGAVSEVELTPRVDSATGNGLIGIMPQMEYRRLGLLASAKEGAHQCWHWTAYTVQTLLEKLVQRERPDLAGPVGIVQMVSRAAHSGLEELVYLIGLISVAIGFFNILPIPLLDGGHAILYVWEGLSRRKLTTQMVAWANSAGLVFLLSLLLFATYNDILRIRDQRRARAQAREAAEQQAPKPPPKPPGAEPAPVE